MALIDKETIRKEIERRIRSIESYPFIEAEVCAYDKRNGKLMAYRDILSFLDTLPEQPVEGLHFTPLNRLIQKIPSKNWNNNVNNYAKKLRDCLIKEGYLKDANVLQDYISYMNGNNVPMATMDEQEQPEEGLDEEISRYLREDCSADDEPSVSDIARHFAEWERKRTLDKVVEWMKKNLTYTHPRKGVETCMVNIGVFLDAMGIGAENLKK